MKEPEDPLEIWGGFECTIARIGDVYRDQIRETGHRDRVEDLDAVRELGITTLRYPVLLEAVSPDHPDRCDWTWVDGQMGRMRSCGLRPIVGLLHHGSGPLYTSLLDPALPDLLARHAARVAARYPWVDLYTPVNEPLTTARFSALYGHWYPHATDLGSFVRAVVLQCRSVVLAMQAVRRVNPHARLVQTEDVGKTFATPALKAQAEHENLRRWLSLDLLCGHLDRHHPWYGFVQSLGVTERDLAFFLECDVRPDIIGINHYLTSERFLDEAVERYPPAFRGGNGEQVFADAEAVRVALPAVDLGPAARLSEVWSRYRRPLAITEVHHGCTRDEQVRWLVDVWRAAEAVRRNGADIRAVTVWALMGSYDWNSLLTRKRGSYEPGAFDIRAPRPRKTALGRAAESLAAMGRYDHPVLDVPGWWRRPERLYAAPRRAEPLPRAARAIGFVESHGPLGAVFAEVCHARGLPHVVLDRSAAVDTLALRRMDLWAIIDTGTTAGDLPATVRWAERCAAMSLAFVAFSSDRVFDGRLGHPYDEDAPESLANRASRALHARECEVRAAHAATLLVRTGPLFDARDSDNPVSRLLSALSVGQWPPQRADLVSLTYAPDLAHAVIDLLIDGETGLWHLAPRDAIDVSALAVRLASLAGLGAPSAEPSRDETTPLNHALTSRRGWPMPSLDDALARFVRDTAAARQAGAALAAE